MNEVGPDVSGMASSAPRWIIVTHTLLPNGPAHRLLAALRRQDRRVGLCAVPMPGGVRTRAEWYFPGRTEPELFIDRQHRVPIWREPLSACDIVRFAWRLRSTGRDPVVIVGCDPVAYLEAITAFGVSGVDVLSDAAWFVDWSAQRLDGRLSGLAYKNVASAVARRATVVGAISLPAAQAIAGLGRSRSADDILILPNLPLSFPDDDIPAWDDRPRGVVYLGGLSPEQGVELLLQAAVTLTDAGCTLDIAGDGPSATDVAVAASRIRGLRFHGVVHDQQELAAIMRGARVGLALYDPEFPMNAFNDPLKVKDYLSAGLRVVTTSPRVTEDGVVLRAPYNAEAIAAAALAALAGRPPSDPRHHVLLKEADQSLIELMAQLEGNA